MAEKEETFDSDQPTIDQDESIDSDSKIFSDACALAEQGHYEQAKEIFYLIDSASKRYGRAQYLLGCACNKLNRDDQYDEALEAFEKAKIFFKVHREMIPLDFLYQQGFAHWKRGIYPEAIRSFSSFIHRCEERDLHRGYLGRALVYFSMHCYTKALDDFDKANEEDANQTVYSLSYRGRTLAYLGDYDRAQEDFHAALRLDAQDYQNHLQLGIVHSELGQYSEALEQFNQALQLCSENKTDRAEVLFRQGLVFQAQHRVDLAMEKFLEVIHLNINHARAYFRLGRLYMSERKYSEALTALNRAHQLAPHNKDIIYELGNLYEIVEQQNFSLYQRSRALGIDQHHLADQELLDLENFIETNDNTMAEGSVPGSIENSLRRQTNPLLVKALQEEESLPLAENRLAFYNKVLASYDEAIQSGVCPEARPFLALCQEAENDFIQAFSSIEAFYDEIENNPEAKQTWTEVVEQLEQDAKMMLLSPLVVHRLEAIKRIDQNRVEIEEDHQSFADDPSDNPRVFYDVLRVRLSQSLVALSMTGCSVPIIDHNLKSPSNTIEWILTYLCKTGFYVPIIGSTLTTKSEHDWNFLYTKDYSLIQKKLSLISALGDQTEFRSVARHVSRLLTDRYKTQLLRLKTAKNEDIRQNPALLTKLKQQIYEDIQTDRPVVRVANFACKYLIETIRDENLHKLGFTRDPRIKMDEMPRILIDIICLAKSNIRRPFLSCTNVDVNNQLPLQRSTSVANTPLENWNLYEFFRAPGIHLEDGSTFADAPWIKVRLYGHRQGDQRDVKLIQKEINEKQQK